MRQASWGEIFAQRHEPLLLPKEVPQEPHGWRRLFWWEELLTFGLLGVIMLTVVVSVDRANWVDGMPSLYPIALLGLAMGALLARVSWREPLLHLIALPAGAAAALGTILTVVPGASPVARYEELHARMAAWFQAADTGGISDDSLPVIVLVVPIAWLAAYMTSWAAFRWHNAWLALAPGGGLLLANISLLPGRFSFAFVVFLLGATLLVTRMHLVEREQGWRDDETPYPPLLSLNVLHATAWIALLLVITAWLLPQANEATALERVWRSATAPVTERVTPYARLFISVDTKKPIQVHDFEDVLPFLGGIDLSNKSVLEVIAPGADQPRYLRAQAYVIYTPDGWQLGDDALTTYGNETTHLPELVLREDVSIQIESLGQTGDKILTLGQPNSYDRDVQFSSDNVQINILGVEAADGLERGDTYVSTGSVSVATEDDLRAAGTDYPDWVIVNNLALPADFPTSVSDLAAELTASETTPYDQSLAIGDYLRDIPYDLDVPDAPHDADAIEYFLFEAQRGYFDYHASAMVVMLRSIGVPARLAVGYVLQPSGEEDDRFRHFVTERNAFAWPEVYFPELGWIEFNPTPNQPPLRRPGAVAPPPPVEVGTIPGAADLNLDAIAGFPGEDSSSNGAIAPDDGGLSRMWIVIGVAAAVATFVALASGSGATVLYRTGAGLEPAAQLWAKTVRLASWARVPPRDSQTPREYARDIAARVPDAADAQRLADAYVRQRFGGTGPDAQEQARLDESWRTVRGGLLRRLFRLG